MEESIQDAFKLVDESNTGKITLQNLRRMLGKNKNLKGLVKEIPSLQGIGVARLFHAAAAFLQIQSDAPIDIETFTKFCDICEWKKNCNEHAVSLYLSVTAAKVTFADLPHKLYLDDRIREAIINEVSRAEKHASYFMCKEYPIGVMLKPRTVRRAMELLDKERGLSSSNGKTTIEELDFCMLCDFALEEWIQKPKMDQYPKTLPRAESFHEMAYDSQQNNNWPAARSFLEQCVLLQPENKVYQLALAEVAFHLEDYEKALEAAESALQASLYFWSPALMVLNDLNDATNGTMRV